MKSNTRPQTLLVILTAVIAAGMMSSCRTTKGFGQDVQHLGNKIEHTADKVGN